MERKNGPVVTMDCPRCAGKGGSIAWVPDRGVCYLCRGKATLEVDIARGERHLAVLRRVYREYRAAGEVEMAEHFARKGLQKRALVDAAKAQFAQEKAS
jgi:hypothetical protein